MLCVNVSQKSDGWKEWRNAGITATDTPVIMGLNPYKTVWRLWAEKTMFVKTPDLSNVPAVRWGNEYEDVARELYESKTDDILLPYCAEYEGNRIFRASFDGIDRHGCPVEIKCPGTKTLEDVKLNGRESETYKRYWGQVQHQMLVAEAPRGYLVFYDHTANDLITFEIERDEGFIEKVLKEGEAFYRCVLNRIEPERDLQRDLFVPKGEEQIENWMFHAQTLIGLEKEIRSHKEAMSQLQTRLEASKAALIEMMGEEFLADYGGVAVTRSLVSGRVDYKAMVEDLLQREPTAAELAPFTSEPKYRWLVRTTDCPSQSIIDKKVLQEIEANSFETRESLWF